MQHLHPILEALKVKGYQPLAVAPNGKKPLHKEWTTRDISLDEVLSKDTARYGIRCGDNGLTCIDIDSKNHSQPELMKAKFFDRIGESMFNAKKVIHQETLSAGAHIFYRAGTPKGSVVLSRNGSGETLVETRGIGGQAVMYELDRCSGIVYLPVLNPEEESILLKAARSFNEHKVPVSNFAEYNETVSCLELLLEQGWSVVNEDESMIRMLRDGNPSSSSSATVYKDSNRVWVFSTSTSLPPQTLLTPADIEIHMSHGGDMKAFAQAMGFTKGSVSSGAEKPQYFTASSISDMRVLAAQKPPKQMVGSFLREKENAILFASTNAGKSVLALQIARAVARGEAISELLPNEVEPQRTVLFDFELSREQMAQRIKGALSDEPYLTFFHPSGDVHASPDEVCKHIEDAIVCTRAKFAVIDNISMLAYDNESAADAKILLSKLKDIRQRNDLTLLIVGHSPKRPRTQSIQVKDLAGSAMVGNMFDAVFALNWSSNGSQCRYVKQLKIRTGEYQFGEESVLSCSITASETDGVFFEFQGTSHEREHLEVSIDTASRDAEIHELARKGLSQREIAKMVGLGKTRVGEILKRVE